MRGQHTRNITVLIIFLSALFSSRVEAQNEKLVAKLECEKTENSNIVRGWFQNNQVLPAVFQYVFSVEKSDTIISQRNSFRAESGQRVPLSRATYFFKNQDEIEKIKLEIFRYGKLVVSDSINIKSTKNQDSAKNNPSQNLSSSQNNIIDIEIDGLILDETRSKMGHDFYEYFYNGWSAPSGVKGFIITIRELPARGRVAQISIEVNDQILLKKFLQPRAELIEGLASQTISLVQNHLKKLEEVNKQILTEDLSGSGIF